MAADDGTNAAAELRKGKRHGMQKPWDEDPDIDRWKTEEFDPSWNEGGLLEVTSFSTPFLKDRAELQELLQEAWPTVKRVLKKFGVSCELNLEEGSMTVSTTRKTRDPYIVVRARDLTKLLARSVPASQAIKILNDDMNCDIINIGKIVRNKKRFAQRRARILGPNLATLKVIETFTGCYIFVQGNTVAAMGPFRGLKEVRSIVDNCIKNKKDPMSRIQELRTERELDKNCALANESWDRKSVKQNKADTKDNQPYTPSPPPQQPSKFMVHLLKFRFNEALDNVPEAIKIDLEPASGKSKRKREAAFIPPNDKASGPSESAVPTNGNNEIADIALAIKKKAKKFRKGKAQEM